MPTTRKPISPKAPKAPITSKASKATTPPKAAPQAKPEAPKATTPFVPEAWVRMGGRGQGFVRYQRLGAGNRHAVSGYNTSQADSAAAKALLADIAKATGTADLGAYVVVDWSSGAIATGCASWADALVVVRHFGGHTSLAGSVHGSASKPMRAAVEANGVAVRPIASKADEADADDNQGADDASKVLADA